jgi:hypothetical protein
MAVIGSEKINMDPRVREDDGNWYARQCLHTVILANETVEVIEKLPRSHPEFAKDLIAPTPDSLEILRKLRMTGERVFSTVANAGIHLPISVDDRGSATLTLSQAEQTSATRLRIGSAIP